MRLQVTMEPAPSQPPSSSFRPHERLHVYKVALDLAAEATSLAQALPKGHNTLAGQIRRSASSCVLNIVEAAARRSRQDKSQRFGMARAEALECQAACRMAAKLSSMKAEPLDRIDKLTDRVSAMLWRLTEKFGSWEGRRGSGQRSGPEP